MINHIRAIYALRLLPRISIHVKCSNSTCLRSILLQSAQCQSNVTALEGLHRVYVTSAPPADELRFYFAMDAMANKEASFALLERMRDMNRESSWVIFINRTSHPFGLSQIQPKKTNQPTNQPRNRAPKPFYRPVHYKHRNETTDRLHKVQNICPLIIASLLKIPKKKDTHTHPQPPPTFSPLLSLQKEPPNLHIEQPNQRKKPHQSNLPSLTPIPQVQKPYLHPQRKYHLSQVKSPTLLPTQSPNTRTKKRKKEREKKANL